MIEHKEERENISYNPENSPKQEICLEYEIDKPLFDWLTNGDSRRPFYIDSIKDLFNRLDKKEISISKFVEVLNVHVYNNFLRPQDLT